jgi:hypothetical protein
LLESLLQREETIPGLPDVIFSCQKIQILIYFGRPRSGLLYTFGHFGIFGSFSTFPPVLVCCTKKNLATLDNSWQRRKMAGKYLDCHGLCFEAVGGCLSERPRMPKRYEKMVAFK